MPPKIIIVVPCYNEQDVLDDTNSKLLAVLETMIVEGVASADSRILYVDDGSTDMTWDLMVTLCHSSNKVSAARLAANVGHQNALLAGLTIGKDWGDALVSIDADLQDDVNAIPQMVRMFGEGKDIVYGVRRKRSSDSWLKRNTALSFYNLQKTLGVRSVYNHADFRLMSKRAVEQLCQYRERNLFLRGIVPMIGYETGIVYYDRSRRTAGTSKYPLRKMINFAIDGITSFSTRPVRLVFATGFVFLFFSLLILGYVLLSLITHHAVPGWTSVILSIWFVGSFVLMGLGIVGEYIGKIYIEVKDRPRYNVSEICQGG